MPGSPCPHLVGRPVQSALRVHRLLAAGFPTHSPLRNKRMSHPGGWARAAVGPTRRPGIQCGRHRPAQVCAAPGTLTCGIL
jgi:hypothetical protein